MGGELTLQFTGWLGPEHDPALVASAALRGSPAEVVAVERYRTGLRVKLSLPETAGISEELATTDALERALATIGCRLNVVDIVPA